MKRFTIEDVARYGLTEVEALVLYYTQSRNDIEAGITDMKARGFMAVADVCESHLRDVEAMLSALTARLQSPKPISDTECTE